MRFVCSSRNGSRMIDIGFSILGGHRAHHGQVKQVLKAVSDLVGLALPLLMLFACLPFPLAVGQNHKPPRL